MRPLLIFLLSLWLSPALAGDKDSLVEKAVKKEVEKELWDVDGKGKPNNPGAKGQANAAHKKATNPGKGSGKNNSVEAKLLDELTDNEKDQNNKNGKKQKKQ